MQTYRPAQKDVSPEKTTEQTSADVQQTVPRPSSAMENEDDALGVGELEGTGFGVGVAPAAAKPPNMVPPSNKQIKPDKRKKSKTPVGQHPSQTNLTGVVRVISFSGPGN